MKKISAQLGFTMIELLIVIAILGILAVAVLSVINPIEQINRGRDTGSQSDAEQLLSAIDRYNAFQGYYPWQINADDPDTSVAITRGSPAVLVPARVHEAELSEYGFNDGSNECNLLDRLSTGVAAFDGVGDTSLPDSCTGAQEIRETFVNRLLSTGYRTLYVYNEGTPGSSTYVCFIPQSSAFQVAAQERCDEGMPADLSAAAVAFICDNENRPGDVDDDPMSCLP